MFFLKINIQGSIEKKNEIKTNQSQQIVFLLMYRLYYHIEYYKYGKF